MKQVPQLEIRIAVDVDGVLGDSAKHVIDRYESENGVSLGMTRDNVTEWDTPIGGTPFGKVIAGYLKDPAWVESMPTIEGAREGFEALQRIGQVIVATSIPEEAEKPRRSWLKKNFDFDGEMLNTMKSGKGDLPAEVLIDDSGTHIDAFVGAKPGERTGILLVQPWNAPDVRRVEGNGHSVQVVKSWSEIVYWIEVGLDLKFWAHTRGLKDLREMTQFGKD